MSILKVENLKKSYENLDVLKGVSLSAKAHEVVSLVGASGSGKSTFLRCLNLLEVPTSGEIYVQGKRLPLSETKNGLRKITNKKDLRAIRADLGMVFQSFNLWSHLNVQENIMEAPRRVLKISREEAAERAETLLRRVGISDKADKYPSQLSGGQQQRVAIARTLALHPKILLFDEPTSALDPEMVGEVLEVIRDLAKEGRTMVVVTHEMNFARDISNHVVFLKDGLIEEEGDPSNLFSNPQTEALQQFLGKVL